MQDCAQFGRIFRVVKHDGVVKSRETPADGLWKNFDIQGMVAGRDRRLTGSIRIGAPDGLGNYFLPPRLVKFQREHQELEVELLPVPLYYSLAKREIDILITVRKPVVGKIIARNLTVYRLGLFAGSMYLAENPPIERKQDLRVHRFVNYIDELLFDQDLRDLEEVSPGLHSSFRSSTIFAQMAATVAGAGIGILPYFLAHQEPTLAPILPDFFIERRFWLQVNPDTQQLARVRATIDFIVAEMSDNSELFLSLSNRGIREKPA